MKYSIITYGCQMNESDAERLATVLEKNNYSPFVPPSGTTEDKLKEADLVAIVSCSVRQMAVDRVYGLIRNITRLRQDFGGQSKIIVTGCLTERDKKKLKKQVDLVFDIKELANLPQLIKNLKVTKPVSSKGYIKRLTLNKTGILTDKHNLETYLRVQPKYSTYPIAYVPIMTGCNNFCAYCVVPYTRGPEVSRPAKEILQEIGKLIKKDYKMIVLLGQNVNSYSSRMLTNPSQISRINNNVCAIRDKFVNISDCNFPKLLKKINDLPGDFWLTFLSSHPKDFSDELIETMTQCNKLMPYLHLPVQAGDDEILHHMNRHYTVAHYKNLIRKIRDKISTISVSTDIIVGFPGETKKQFANTAKLMREIKFDMAYLAKYSPRPGTAAWKLPNNVSTQEKEKRWQTLNAILKKTGLENNKKYLRKVIEVLITELGTRNNELGIFLGQTKSFKNVRINRESTLIKSLIPQIGDMVKVKITKINPWGLEGKII